MPTVRLSFSPAPAHVRTARLVGVAMARRAGVAEDLLEEVRLAIGEACSRAVALHRSVGNTQLIDVSISDGERFTVLVTDHAAGIADPFRATSQSDAAIGAPLGGQLSGSPVSSADDQDLGIKLAHDKSNSMNFVTSSLGPVVDALAEEIVVARMGLALLAGLVDDLEVVWVSDGIGTEVRMSWPLSCVKRNNGDEI